MQTFKDNKENVWTIELNYDAMRRVQADTRLDLTSPFPSQATGESVVWILNSSIIRLLDVLWSICRPKAEERGIKRPWFEAAIEGEPIEEARLKLLDELIAFFQRNRRTAEAEFVAENKSAIEKLQVLADELSSNSASVSPPSSESTPAPIA